ncbi:unnamed protein product [Cochlearia groenlandica]
MTSSKKPNKEKNKKEPSNDDGVNKDDARSSDFKSKKRKTTAKSENIVEKETEVYEISDSSSGESVEGKEIRDEPNRSNGGAVEEAKMFRFPMNRIRRIMRNDDSAPQIMQDAVFLVNKATELFIERFSEEAYESSVKDKKKFIHYKHLSSVVSKEERYEFLEDCVPEKVKAAAAVDEWERAMADA